ncbi:MAG: hypothetical protein R3281_09280, partial [Balneolaceae bacterium]|nr:hypothetical protein [Balneolaceae bacterium]
LHLAQRSLLRQERGTDPADPPSHRPGSLVREGCRNGQTGDHPVEEPGKELRNLLQIYWEGLHRKIPCFGNTSYQFANAYWPEEQDPEAAIQKARNKAWNRYKQPEISENRDPYISLFYHGENPLQTTEFREWALRIWNPLLQNREERKSLE